MFGLFKKKELAGEKDVVAFATGEVVELSKVPDDVFSSGMLGDGLAIEITEGTIVSPVDGVIETIFPTKHAVGIKTADGVEFLIHIGLDTVNLKGEGFTSFVEDGAKVKKGDKLIQADIEFIKSKDIPTITVFVQTSDADEKKVEFYTGVSATAGDTVIAKL